VIEKAVRVRDILEILRFEVWIRELAIKVFDPSVLVNAHIGDTREFPAIVHSLPGRETGTPRVDQGIGNDHQAQVRQAKRILAVPANPNGSQPG
jgi:hypothetical protein